MCSKKVKKSWENVIKKRPSNYCKDVDYESTQPQRFEKNKLDVYKGNQIDILTFEQLEENPHLFTPQVIAKFTTIVCDDS